MRVFIQDQHCPGDTLEITAAVRDLCVSHPDIRVNVRTTAQELWDNNPHLDKSVTRLDNDISINIEMPLLANANAHCWHSIDIVRDYLADQLHVRIPPGPRRADLHLTDAEKAPSWPAERYGIEGRYSIICAGGKTDYTVKIWEFERFQQVVDATPDIQWIQIGAAEHRHKGLRNVIDLRGRTTHRELVRLMYHAKGCLCGLSYPMHLASMQTPYGHVRPCIVLNGGREPPQFSAYPGHVMLHAIGTMPCCANGGCWKARVERLPDGDPKNLKLCEHPVKCASGQTIPACMDSIKVSDVVSAIRRFQRGSFFASPI